MTEALDGYGAIRNAINNWLCVFGVYSTRQLMRIIKECTGKKFKEVITDMRLDDAKRMLHETTLPIEEVAFAVGYENLSSFARVFRERVGMTPSAFRAYNVMI